MIPAEDQLAVLIMAAGKGTRMKSDLPKVLHKLRGRAMIHWVVDIARSLGADPIVLIVGHQKEKVIEELQDPTLRFAAQEPQLGTGHAVMCALPAISDCQGHVLILSGDVPLIKPVTLRKLWLHHQSRNAAVTVLTARTDNPHGYGRIVRQPSGNLTAIIEERDASDTVRKINEINSGIYIFQLPALRRIIPHIGRDNDQKEYYLTDAVRILAEEGEIVGAFEGDFHEVTGINTIEELQNLEKELPR